MQYKKCLISPVIGRVHYRDSVLQGNVGWNLKGVCYKMSATKRFCYVSLTVISSVPEKSVHCREVSAL